MPHSARGDPVMVTRVVSAMVRIWGQKESFGANRGGGGRGEGFVGILGGVGGILGGLGGF